MSGGRLPNRIMFENLVDAVRRGRSRKEKKWTNCVQSDLRAFDIAGDCKVIALAGKVLVDTVTEGGRRLWPGGGKQR